MVCIADRIPDSQQLLDGLLEGRDYTTITQRFSSRSSDSAVSPPPRPLQAARLAKRCSLLRSRRAAPSCWTDATSSTSRFGGRVSSRWLVSADAVDFQHTTTAAPPNFPCTRADKGTTVQHKVSEARAIFPARAWVRRALFALTPCVPLSRATGEGEIAQGAPPFAPTPLFPHSGRGAGDEGKTTRAPRLQRT